MAIALHLAFVSIPERGTIPFFIDDLCHIEGPLALISVLSIAVINGSTISSEMSRCPIAVILSLITTEIVFNLLSNVLLFGGDNSDIPHAFITFLLYGRSVVEKYSCNALFESSLNHIRTIKHLIITVVE